MNRSLVSGAETSKQSGCNVVVAYGKVLLPVIMVSFLKIVVFWDNSKSFILTSCEETNEVIILSFAQFEEITYNVEISPFNACVPSKPTNDG